MIKSIDKPNSGKVAKYIKIAELLKERVQSGEYAGKRLPGIPSLASELGASYLTARQAVGVLVNDGTLNRDDKGRLWTSKNSQWNQSQLKVAFIFPAHQNIRGIWHQAVEQAVKNKNGTLRPISFCSNNDPIIFETLDGDYDIILILATLQKGELLTERLIKEKDRVITLYQNLTEYGIPCIDGPAHENVEQLIKHLSEKGYKQIDCFNVEPESIAVTERIKAWEKAKRKYKIKGNLYNNPVKAFEPALSKSYDVIDSLISGGKFNSKAIFCISVECAMGIFRRCYEAGIEVGNDLAVCSFGQPHLAKLLIPSLTVVNNPDPTTQIEAAISCLTNKKKVKNLMFRPKKVDLLYGESTCGKSKANRKGK